MELLPSDAETLRKMIAESWFPYKERELEATFGVNGVVDSTRFLAVAQRLKSRGLKEVRQPDRLTISLEDNTRYTIQGEGTIAQYCEDNTLAGKSAIAMIKDRAGDLHTLDLKDYDTRIKIRRELPLDMNDPRVKSHLATWDQRVKFFRLIQRWTFVGNGVIFDLSMVRSTKKDERGLWKQVKKFYDAYLQHDIFKEQPTYEIEVELDRESEYANEAPKALASLVQGLGEVLRGIQRNPILIRNSVRDKVLEGYKTLVGASEEPGKRGFRGVQPVTLERSHMAGFVLPGRYSIRQGYNVTDKADGLRVMGYCDEKGELFLLDMSLNVYRSGLKKLACARTLVDGEWVTQNKDGEPVQMLMLFDIYHGLDSLVASSLPFYNEIEESPTRYKALLAWMATWRGEGGPISLVKGLTPQNSLKVMEKKFLFGTKGTDDIFVKCEQMLDRKVNYNTDGLILTANLAPLPDRFGVRFNQQFKWKPAKDNTIDFLVKIVKDQETKLDKLTDILRPDSADTIKYKTLRLYVGTSADPAYDDPRRTILLIKKLPSGRPGGKGAKKYRMRPVLFSPKQFEDSMASVCYLEANEERATGEWVVRCTSHTDGPGEATGDPITNNSIVEMRYDPDPTLPSGWNWVPIRVRYDKTERFQSGSIEKTLNSVETAESVWNSIHEPVTTHMIKTGSENPSEEEQAEIKLAKERSVAMSGRYYQKKSSIKNVSLVKSMASFHNLVIKGQILTDPILTVGHVHLGLPQLKQVIDTSIGKGGDIGRYMNGVGHLLGIDIDADGIRDPDEGAYRRYLDKLVEESRNRFAQTPPMLFLIGDSSKSYIDGKAGINEEEADMMRATFGKVPPAAKLPPYVESKFRDQFKLGADLITSMFSIHYYFETKEKWEGFLNNIRDNLKVGGFFTCCCFDGNLVTDLLRNLEKGDELVGTDEDTNATIWKVTKQNTLGETLPSTSEEGFGQAIDVEFLSIGSSHREYLVSPQLLIQQLNSIGCDLASNEDCKNLGLAEPSQLFEVTYNSNLSNPALYPMTQTVKDFSFFNRWYIFRRYSTAPMANYEARTPEAATTPAYRPPNSPPYAPQSPAYRPPNSPPYAPQSPAYRPPNSPPYRPTSPTNAPRTPEYEPPPPAPWPSSAPAELVAYNPFPNPLKGEIPPGWEKLPDPWKVSIYRQKSTGHTVDEYPPLPWYNNDDGEKAGFDEQGDIIVVNTATGRVVRRQPYKSYFPPPGFPISPYVSPTVGAANASAAAALNNRPPSSAWQGVPLSGNAEQNEALAGLGAKTPPLAATENESDILPPAPLTNADMEPSDLRDAQDEWYEAKYDIEERAKARVAPTLPGTLSAEERDARLQQAADAAVAAAIQRYRESQSRSGLVTAVVEGGARTVAVERATAAGPQKKYKATEIFRFFGRAELKDSLGIGDAGAARWLALSAPFPIKDKGIEYPTVNHYLAGMKYKLATDKPELAEDIFSSKGTIHTKYLRLRDQIASKHKGEKEKPQVKEQEDQELLRSEAADVADAALAKTIKRYKAQFNEATWIASKDDVLKEALNQRWKYDARFRKIVEAARQKDKYLLYYTGSSTLSSFGGIRRDDGRIEGENQVGKIIMTLAGFPPV
jgi:predicted NAD-dependent protein-ADP-ribosyltransferase YbiA (DUF1768 family)